MNLSRKTALITGGARRVGRAIAIRLAESGCNVAIHFHQSESDAAQTVAACRGFGVRSESFAANLADLAQAQELPARVAQAFGSVDFLINNASDFERMTLNDFTIEQWERTLRINVTAPMVLAHAARKWLRAAGGRIVNLCDAATARPMPSYLAYGVSKGALETLTRVLARAFAPEVNVVGIAPGVAEWPPDYDEQTRTRLTGKIPLQRAGTPDDVAVAVRFVLQDADYMTGTILTLDGGRSAV